ncbi:hypothetical protein [Microvirga sp. Mcv34]|uniref:hypothetical protein n=1 Tax=Microvirga sp. Mcv34 TaxID=2926016 RepID=UPI0021C9EC1C|nr:hypothetical protein [Microvirga sp. Mcv34]
MKNLIFFTLAAAATINLYADPVTAAGFECPRLSDLDTPPLAAEIDLLVPKGPLLEEPSKLNSAIDLLRTHGVSRTDTVNHLIAFYCPAVADNSVLSDVQKTERVMQFSQMVTRLVLTPNTVEDVIYNVPLPPNIAQVAMARAQQNGLTLEEWIAQLVEAATR